MRSKRIMINYRILILVDNARRDLMSCYVMRKAFENLGCKVKFCSKRNYNLVFNHFCPDAFLVTRGDYPFLKSFSNQAKIFVVPSEGGRLTAETMRSVFFGRFHKQDNFDQFGNVITDFNFITRVYLWGVLSKQLMEKEDYLRDGQVRVVGNPRLDIYSMMSRKKQSAMNSDIRNTIGIAVSVKSLSCAPAKPNYLQLIHGLLDERTAMRFPMVPEGRHYEDFVWRDFAVARKLMTLVKRIINETDAVIKIRVGPFEDPKDYYFLKEMYPGRVLIQKENELLLEFIEQIDCLLTCWSTTGLESVICEKPVIAFPFTMDRKHLSAHVNEEANGFNSFLKLYHTPVNDNECISLIKSALSHKLADVPDRKFRDDFLMKLYNLPNANIASEIIAEDVLGELTRETSNKPQIFQLFRDAKGTLLEALSNLFYLVKDWSENKRLEQLQYQTKNKKLASSLSKYL